MRRPRRLRPEATRRPLLIIGRRGGRLVRGIGQPTPYKRKPWPSPTATPKLPSAADVYPGVEARIVEAEMVELPFGDVGYMGVSADSVWAEATSGLIRIDPDDMSVVTVDDTPGFGMFANESSVWVSDPGRATVTRFDPQTASAGVVAKVYGDPNAISVFGDSLWVAEHHGGGVTRLEEPSGAVVTEIKVGFTGRSGPQGVTATADAVWSAFRTPRQSSESTPPRTRSWPRSR